MRQSQIKIEYHFVPFQVLKYVKEDLKGDLLHDKKSEDAINDLMETGPEDKRRIEQLTSAVKATEKALEIVSDISVNALLKSDEVFETI